MKIEVIEHIQNKNQDLMKFILEGVTIELANAFRRIILTEVPSMAITEVLFVENDSVLFDEMIAHRLALIPLTTDLKNYNLPDECSCGGQGCTLCQVQLECDVRTKNNEVIVYSGDLKSMDDKIRPVSDNIIIGKLGKKSSIVFEAYAQLGIGMDHAKFQPVCSVGYKYFPDIKIDNSKLTETIIDDIIKHDHTKIFKKVDGKLTLIDKYWKGPDLTGSAEKYAPPGAIKENFVPNKYIFTIEATGALPIKEILSKAIEIFLEKLDEFEDQLKKVVITQRV
ncbi:MAG: DNA-directed RNA polymerase subunit D [Promethearchaeota archaeon]